MSPVAIRIDLDPRITLAAWQNAVPVVRRMAIENGEDQALEDLTARIVTDPKVADPWERRIAAIGGRSTWVAEPVDLRLSAGMLSRQTERQVGRLDVEVRRGEEVLGRSSHDIEVLAPNQWPGARSLPELLAAWVLPNHPALVPVLRSAADRVEGRALPGYQRREAVPAMVQAVYEALQASGVRYITPPASFEEEGQKIRTPDQVVEGRLGTCLDLTVVLAALLEQCGLNPLLIVVDGHAFPGVWLVDESFPTPVIDDPTPLRKRLRLGQVWAFDSSAVTSGIPFARAREVAEATLAHADRFRFAVDVATARRHRIRPLPLPVGATAATALDEAKANEAIPSPKAGAPAIPLGEGQAGAIPSPEGDAEASPALAPRAEDDEDELPRDPSTTSTRLERWRARLLDLTLRNKLLNFREGRTAVPLVVDDLGAVEDALAGEQTFRIYPRAEVLVGRDGALHALLAGEDAARTFVAEERAKGVLHADLTEAELCRRLRELWRAARSALEETGAITLYLAMGMLRWFEADASDVPRRAPILLVPVNLEPGRGGRPYTLRIAEDETRVNVTLLRKLEVDFDLDVAGLDVPPRDDAGVDVPRVLREFAQLVRDLDRWDVLDEVYLARFSFTKFLMWLDLAAHADRLLQNPIVKHIFEGRSEAFPLAAPLVPEERLDERPAVRTFTVKDADPSQLQAIFAAADGSSFVLQGPPGTGKSQTITNMVAQLLAEGRTVLFVSQKMAALQVVKHRLDEAGLGPFCLELHSDQASKKAVMEQFKKAFEARGLRTPAEWERLARQLERARKQLDDFAALLRRKGPFGLGLFEVCSRLIGLADVPRVPMDFEAMDEDRFEELREVADRLARAVARVDLQGSPWAGARHRQWSPAWAREVEQALAELGQAVEAVALAASEALRVLRLPSMELDVPAVQQLAELSGLVLDSPEPPLMLVHGRTAAEVEAEVQEWLGHVRARTEGWGALAPRYQARLLEADLDELYARFKRWGSAFFLLAFFMLWGARRVVKRLVKGTLPPARQVASDLATALAVRAEDRTIAGIDAEARALLGRAWRGAQTDPLEVEALLEWARRFREAALRATAELRDLSAVETLARLATELHAGVARGSPGGAGLEAFQAAAARLATAREALSRLLELDDLPGTLPELRAQVERWRGAMDTLRDWCDLQAALQAAREAGIAPLAEAVLRGEVASDQIRPALDRAVYQWWWEGQLAGEPLLRDFRASDQEALIRRFQELDKRSIELGREVVRARLAAKVPSLHAPGDEMALLRRQLQLTRRHMPLRKLFARIPTALRRVKPCVLMSPLSVARYLDPSGFGPPGEGSPGEKQRFDVVIFDEASQIPPWDAIGAIARGKQLIVVGDSKQLPPTTFFDRDVDEADLPDDEDAAESESILDEVLGSGFAELGLRWHYRSRHESLIAFSNHQYYEGRLHTFPSAADRVPGLGVELRPVPDGFYDRGASRTNPREAEAVVSELERILTAGGRSVGVVTFGLPQQRLVEDLVDRLREQRPELERWFTKDVPEPVFVKNLENVQGDERDVMLVSICYGPDRNGKVTMNFGPLNRKGGERRLNVAVTRARERLVVFSTLRADQIDLNRTRAVGVAHLRTYLDYADRGMLAIQSAASPTGREPDSPFEEQVKARLEEEGWTVHPQVGCSGYRIDLAVVDPDRPGSYLLAVECDGATYHSSANARERDRLRQEVLERLGWRFHRVWSTEWWLAPDREMARLCEALEAARAARQRLDSPEVGPPVKTSDASGGLNPARRMAEAGRKAADAAGGSNRTPSGVEPPVTAADVPAAGGVSRRIEGASSTGSAPPQPAAPTFAEQLAWGSDPAVPEHAQPYRVPTLEPMGDSTAFYRNMGAVGARLREVVAACGPIHVDLAGRIVIAAWGMRQLGSRIERHLEAARERLPEGARPVRRGDWLWPPGVDPATWRGIRLPGEAPHSQRPAEYLPPEEVANAAEWVLGRAVGAVEREDLYRETARIFGMTRLGRKVRAAMKGGVDLLVATGRAVEREGWLRSASS